MYDYYWPGYEDSAPLGHNTVCLLTEVASANIATPRHDRRPPTCARRRGCPPTPPQINFPDPWPGGRWTLRDIVDYDLSAVRGLLHAVSAYRERIVANFYDMGARAVEAGRRGGPFAFVIPPDQYDARAAAKLEELLLQGAIEIHRALEPFVADGTSYPAGSDIILLAQPYRAYVKTLLERQRYPVQRSSPGASPERPYDVAGWTLPAQMGVDVRTIERAFEPPADVRLTSATIAAGQRVGRAPAGVLHRRRSRQRRRGRRQPARRGRRERVVEHQRARGRRLHVRAGLDRRRPLEGGAARRRIDRERARPAGDGHEAEAGRDADDDRHGARRAVQAVDGERRRGMDALAAGTARVPLPTITDAEVRAGGLKRQYDAIILPSASAQQLLDGNPADGVPAEYVGGLGEPGIAALKAFVEAGGTLICLDQACALPIEELELPIRDVAREASADAFFCPDRSSRSTSIRSSRRPTA